MEPNIEVPEAEFRMRAAEGDVVEHAFEVKNTGGVPLEINDVKRGYQGCPLLTKSASTARLHERIVLFPGESRCVPVPFDTRGYSGEARKTATIFSNDPDTPMVSLNLVVDVEQAVTVTPSPSVFFSGLLEDQQETKTVEVVSATPDELRITSATSSSPSFVVKENETEAGRRYKVSVSTVPPLPLSSRA